MKLTVKTVKVPALLLAIVMAFACFANVGSRNASAAAAYGEELVTNGDFEDFRSEFGADIEETNPVSPQPCRSALTKTESTTATTAVP